MTDLDTESSLDSASKSDCSPVVLSGKSGWQHKRCRISWCSFKIRSHFFDTESTRILYRTSETQINPIEIFDIPCLFDVSYIGLTCKYPNNPQILNQKQISFALSGKTFNFSSRKSCGKLQYSKNVLQINTVRVRSQVRPAAGFIRSGSADTNLHAINNLHQLVQILISGKPAADPTSANVLSRFCHVLFCLAAGQIHS